MNRIVQIELTNYCNRACSYCGNPVMQRKKGKMSPEVFYKCVDTLKQLGQTSVGINHYGESTIHPRYTEWIRVLNDNEILPFVYTNGDLLIDELIDKLSKLSFSSFTISGHMPIKERVALAEKCRAAGIDAYYQPTLDSSNAISIGKQIEGIYIDSENPPLSNPSSQCRFLVEKNAIVLWDGGLVPCCCDFDGKGIFGNIMDKNAIKHNPSEFLVCKTCPGHPGNIVL